jgi:UDP-N-acetylmuramoyl-L-alanyl-D-glutamate--2,6-diaminopimelate ligase
MTLAELKRLVADVAAGTHSPGLLVSGNGEVEAVTEDSRRVRPGTAFFAARGSQHDGHCFVDAAIEAGAVAVVGDRGAFSPAGGVPYFASAAPRTVLGIAAHALAGNPSQRMNVIGVTGTNGKSSIVTLLRHVLEHAGRPAAAFGTLGYVFRDGERPALHTTPFAEDLAALFKRAYESGHREVAMEVSSHALAQDRVAGIAFDVAVFTNLTQDHLDFHSNMEEYRSAKLRLFEVLNGYGPFAVVNQDDPNAHFFVDATAVRCYTYGAAGEVRARRVQAHLDGTQFEAVTPWGEIGITMKLAGLHNVSNVLAVVTVCGGLGVPLEQIAAGIASLDAVPGRFERVDCGQPFHVIVDYAHTEDGLRNVLAAARTICSKRILTVFGCGGDRDRSKRPKMAAAVATLADFGILTSDNPRTEDPLCILLDVESGMQQAGKKRGDDYVVIEDRRAAIRTALALAQPGDLVLIAGKGHEDYQILGTRRVPFDDRVVAREMLEALG